MKVTDIILFLFSIITLSTQQCIIMNFKDCQVCYKSSEHSNQAYFTSCVRSYCDFQQNSEKGGCLQKHQSLNQQNCLQKCCPGDEINEFNLDAIQRCKSMNDQKQFSMIILGILILAVCVCFLVCANVNPCMLIQQKCPNCCQNMKSRLKFIFCCEFLKIFGKKQNSQNQLQQMEDADKQ